MPLNHPSSHESVEMPKRDMVAGLVVRDGKLLLVHNIKHGLRIEPPGGKVQMGEGETLEQAVVRELSEELGIRVEPMSLLGTYDTHSPEGDFRVHMFVCEILEGEPQQDLEPEKIGHVAWFSPEELIALKTGTAQSDPQLLVPNMHAALDAIIAHMKGVSPGA